MICNHPMCDLCGWKSCYNTPGIKKYGNINVCASCVESAVRTVYDFACRWGGTIIDPNKPCGETVVTK